VPVALRAAASLLLVGLTTGLALAADASPVVARVGEATLTVEDVERRLKAFGAAQLAALDAPAGEEKKRFVEQTLVPELFSHQEAKARGLDKTPKFADREREILRQQIDRTLKEETLVKTPVTAEEIKAYFEENKARFNQPARVRIWRILVDDEANARKILEQAKAAGSPAKWSELCRSNSVDKATSLRQGDLGFVHPDGNTDAPRVRVDPALFRAANAVRDGELVATPIKEGAKFAVVWRRGSLPSKNRTLEQERSSIRSLLERRRVDDARKSLLQQLRNQHVRDEHPERLEILPEGLFGSKMARPRPSPGLSPRRPAIGSSVPSATPRGLR
jgi:peptidyl-prolyl cis-trans isomerase C